jgi:hypothetical protein
MRYLAGSITSRPGRDDARDPETRFVSFLIFVQLHRERACGVGGEGGAAARGRREGSGEQGKDENRRRDRLIAGHNHRGSATLIRVQ